MASIVAPRPEKHWRVFRERFPDTEKAVEVSSPCFIPLSRFYPKAEVLLSTAASLFGDEPHGSRNHKACDPRIDFPAPPFRFLFLIPPSPGFSFTVQMFFTPAAPDPVAKDGSKNRINAAIKVLTARRCLEDRRGGDASTPRFSRISFSQYS